eukprot:scaffold1487_cov116-Isochrysis_galbana.AAC.19
MDCPPRAGHRRAPRQNRDRGSLPLRSTKMLRRPQRRRCSSLVLAHELRCTAVSAVPRRSAPQSWMAPARSRPAERRPTCATIFLVQQRLPVCRCPPSLAHVLPKSPS